LEPSSSNSGSVAVAGAIIGGAHAEAKNTSALPTNTWTYLSETYDGSAVRLYVNGNLVSSAPASGSIASSSNPLQIGGDSIYGQYFNGLIDEVRVYNTALTQAQIQTDMTTPVSGGGGGGDTTPPSAPGTLSASAAGSSQVNVSWGAATDNVAVAGYRVERCQGSGCSSFVQVGSTTGATTFADTGLSASTSYSYRVRAVDGAGNAGPYSNVASASTSAGGGGPTPVAAFGFEEGSGGSTADASGNGNNGSLVNAAWSSAGKFGDALSFNGTNARVDVPDAASLHLSSGMTLEAWVNPASVSAAWKDAIYKGNDNYYLEPSS
jgi:hypothetical protein